MKTDFPELDPSNLDPGFSIRTLLERAALQFPERGIAIFDGRGRRHERRTYAEILQSVRRAAGRWAALGVEPGDRVLISQPTSWTWLDAWLGATILGALPVAVAPGAALGGGSAHIRKVDGLVERLDARSLQEGYRRIVCG